MITQLAAQDLIVFEDRVCDAFLAQRIHAPIHLSKGNEEFLLAIFEHVRERDWVFTTWRSHYHCLLKGVPPEELFAEILAGRSMYLNFPQYKIVASSLVGGILPIAVGVAMGIKRKGLDEVVWAFIGDMAATTGICREATQYVMGHGLPLRLVVEDNGLSTNTPTQEVWRDGKPSVGPHEWIRYSYERGYPHTGAGQWVTFA